METAKRDQFKEDESINITQKSSHALHFLGCNRRHSHGFRGIWGSYQQWILWKPCTTNQEVEKEEPSVWVVLPPWQCTSSHQWPVNCSNSGLWTDSAPTSSLQPWLGPFRFFFIHLPQASPRGRHFSSKEDLQKAVTDFLDEKSSNFFENAFSQLALRWQKCVGVFESYVEK